MANSYQDTTGVLRLKQVTPVIKALFAGYNIDATYPGNGEAYIGVCESLDAHPDWVSLMVHLEALCEKLGIQNIEESDGYPDSATLLALFKKFDTNRHPMVPELLRTLEACDQDPDLKWLFNVAQLLDDGHGLEYYQTETAWYCSKPRLSEFGGDGEFHSHYLNLYSSSHTAERIGPEFHQALVNHAYADAAKYVTDLTQSTLDGIVKLGARHQVAQATIAQLTQHYQPFFNYPEPSNDPPSQLQQRMFNAAKELFGK